MHVSRGKGKKNVYPQQSHPLPHGTPQKSKIQEVTDGQK
jgi:hypothetical protein